MYQILLINLHQLINVLRSKFEKKLYFILKENISSISLNSLSIKSNGNESTINKSKTTVDFNELQQYYLTIQNKHVEAKKQRYKYTPNADGL